MLPYVPNPHNINKPGALFAAGVFLHGEVDDCRELEFCARLKDVGVDGVVDVDALGRGEVSIAENGLLSQVVRHDSLKNEGKE